MAAAASSAAAGEAAARAESEGEPAQRRGRRRRRRLLGRPRGRCRRLRLLARSHRNGRRTVGGARMDDAPAGGADRSAERADQRQRHAQRARSTRMARRSPTATLRLSPRPLAGRRSRAAAGRRRKHPRRCHCRARRARPGHRLHGHARLRRARRAPRSGSAVTFVTAASGSGGPPMPAPPQTRARLGPDGHKLKLSPTRFRRGRRAATIARAAKALPTATTISFVLSQAATVTLSFEAPTPGVLAARRCVASDRPTARQALHALRADSSWRVTLAAHAGTDRITFDGVLDGAAALAPGSYRLSLAAAASAAARPPRSTPPSTWSAPERTASRQPRFALRIAMLNASLSSLPGSTTSLRPRWTA